MRTRGFTIIELFIAVGLTSVLVFLAAPRLAETRRPSLEAAAIGALKTIATCQQLHRDGGRGVPARGAYTDLAGLRRADLVDDALAAGTLAGYVLEVAPSTTEPRRAWRAVATPTDARSELRPLAITHDGVLHRGLPGQRLWLPPDTCEVPADLAHLRVGK